MTSSVDLLIQYANCSGFTVTEGDEHIDGSLNRSKSRSNTYNIVSSA